MVSAKEEVLGCGNARKAAKQRSWVFSEGMEEDVVNDPSCVI
jgi:hypothetical protein